MQLIDVESVQYERFSPHRPGMSQNKRLLAGQEGAPDNFELSLVLSSPDYATPRHRHNFDQIRFMLSGTFGYGEKATQTEGSISYFPEGVPYAQQAREESVTLLLQFGGASGEGFMSYRQLEQGYAELCEKGTFDKGIFSWHDDNGQRHNKDAYEAIWEHVMGRTLHYPKARYDAPVLMVPEAYEWVPLRGEPGVEIKVCGRFSERDIGLGFIRIAAGARHTAPSRRLYYALSGNGTVGGRAWKENFALNPEEETGVVLEAASDSEFVFFDRPDFMNEAEAAA